MSLIRIRMRRSISVIYHELYCIACCLLGKAKVRLFFDKERTNRVELGADVKRSGFMLVDLNIKAPYPYDLRAGLPFPDASIDFIYAEHVLEHFDHDQVHLLLGECRRVMKPGATLSVCVPDAGIFLDGYAHPDQFDVGRFCQHPTLDLSVRINYVNYMFYMDGFHRYMFDEENLLRTLESAGFVDVASREFDPDLDQQVRRHESIYATARKRG
ncbi:class I SAM-dependent methyltransferase [Geomonas subterranea]|uniref:class I SAM-dependent methyltransferase n=1 Tax=Geomonas subterranea TaxID=2847989 RepID=UPI001CD7ACD0|nr:methyltransferase domain-containing protein [Geomonas fuzhouensis]